METATGSLKQREDQTLTEAALQVWLWANAHWTPARGVGLPTSSLPSKLGMKRATFCSALKELRRIELLIVLTSAIRPGAAGSADGPKCATYHLPQRMTGSPQRFNIGDPKHFGHWRVDAGKLDDIAMNVRSLELRVFVCVVLPHDRYANGGLQNLKAAHITVAGAKALLDPGGNGPAKRTFERAFISLVERGLLRCIAPSAGRRPAVYVPDGVAAFGQGKHERPRK